MHYLGLWLCPTVKARDVCVDPLVARTSKRSQPYVRSPRLSKNVTPWRFFQEKTLSLTTAAGAAAFAPPLSEYPDWQDL